MTLGAALVWLATSAGPTEAGLACGETRTIAVDRGTDLIVRSDGWLRVRESGVDLWLGSPAQAIDGRPPRLAEAFVPARAEVPIRIESSESVATAIVELGCAEPWSPQRCWLETRRAVEAADTQALRRLASGRDTCAALAQHELAHLASQAGEHQAGHAQYRALVDRWQGLGDGDRAAAAALGMAEQSLAAGRFRRAVSEAELAENLAQRFGPRAFARRARVTRATALRRVGRAVEAKAMVLKLIDEYQQLGECNEAVNLRINAAQWANLAGDTAELSSWVDALDGAERCALTPAVRNRLALLRGRYAVVQGDLASAMKSYAAAVAAETNNVQRAQTRRALADVYRQLGMHGEALTQIAVALKELPASESPQRVALALMVLSAIQHDRADWQSAARWATEARAIFERHGQDHEAQLAQTAAAEAWLQSGDIEQAKRAFGAELSSDQRPQRCLLAAELQIAAKQPAAARRLLGSPGCRARTLDDQLRHAVLSAKVANETDSAQSSFLPIALQVQRLLSDSNVALRFAAVRRTRVLREALLARDDWNPDTIGDLILATHPYRSPPAAGAAAPSVSSALGSLLLSAEAEPAATSAALGAQLGALGRTDGDADVALPSTDAVRTALADGQWLLMLALGQQRSAAVWVSGEQLLVRALPGQRQLLAAVDAIHEGLRLRDDERLDGAIAELSAMLFAEAPAFGAELLVLADERLSSIPLALLRPNGRDPLIATTAASWVSSFSTKSRAAPAGDIGVVVASNLGPGASDKLAPLYSAEQEPSLLKAAVPDATIEVHAGLGATPLVLHRELMQSGRLVHVAAHGIARPQALGYAGLWLAPEKAGGDPQFLSWLDMAAQPLHASLAVLNACQMAAGSTHIGTPSFALAVSTAGVDNVIAASWPISDAASSVWVPVFYRALDRRRPDSSADALRQAQLALMKSRYFRHPYYWASLAHFRQLQIAAPPRE